MSEIRHKFRVAQEIVDAAIMEAGRVPRCYGGHVHGAHAENGLIVRPYFQRGDKVRHSRSGDRGEFRGMIGHGGALVHFGARGKRVVPVRVLERLR